MITLDKYPIFMILNHLYNIELSGPVSQTGAALEFAIN